MRASLTLLAGVIVAALTVSYAISGSTTLSLPSGTGTARVGTDGSANLFGNVGLCDGAACANMAVVKAASTAPAAADPALVVAVSPNSALGFTPSGNYSTPLSASTTSSNVALPAGSPSTIMVYNTGANAAYINLGTSSSATATTSGVFLGGGAAMPLVVGSNTYLAAITASGTTTINIAGGSGLGTASGGAGTVLNANANVANNADSIAPSTNVASPVADYPFLFDGTNWNRARSAGATGVAAIGGGAAVGSAPSNPVPLGAYAGGATGGLVAGLVQADSSAAINVSTATTTQLVALSSGRKIYVTSYDVIAAGTGNITFEYGTGTNCGTGTTVLTGAYNLTAQAGIAKGGGLGPVLVVPAGNALCVLTTAAVQMSGSVSYAQF